jgi:hypothetical protein
MSLMAKISHPTHIVVMVSVRHPEISRTWDQRGSSLKLQTADHPQLAVCEKIIELIRKE